MLAVRPLFHPLARDDRADARTSRAGPDWVFGERTHGPLSSTHWISVAKDGALRIISLADGTSHVVSTPYVSISALCAISPTQVAVLGRPATKPALIAVLSLSSASSAKEGVKEEILKLSSSASVDPAFISEGSVVSYPTPDGAKAYGIYYPPASGTHSGVDGTLPPLVTHVHGGPTASASRGLGWGVAFFTSRGFAYVDVDYGGSTGASLLSSSCVSSRRARSDPSSSSSSRVRQGVPGAPRRSVGRRRHQGHHRVRRVPDQGGQGRQGEGRDHGRLGRSVSLALLLSLLAAHGLLSLTRARRLAGGFTVLGSLANSKVFTAGTSYFGVADIKMLCDDTHKVRPALSPSVSPLEHVL